MCSLQEQAIALALRYLVGGQCKGNCVSYRLCSLFELVIEPGSTVTAHFLSNEHLFECIGTKLVFSDSCETGVVSS